MESEPIGSGPYRATQSERLRQRVHTLNKRPVRAVDQFGDDPATAFERDQSTHSAAGGFRRGSRERLASQLRQYFARCPMCLTGQDLGRFEHVVIYFKGSTHLSELCASDAASS